MCLFDTVKQWLKIKKKILKNRKKIASAQFYKQNFHQQFFSFARGSHCQGSKAAERKLPVMTESQHLGYFSSIYQSNKISAFTSSESISPIDSKLLTAKKRWKLCSLIPTSLLFSKQLQWSNHKHPCNWWTKMSLQSPNCALIVFRVCLYHSLCPVIRIKDLAAALCKGRWRGSAGFCITCSRWDVIKQEFGLCPFPV